MAKKTVLIKDFSKNFDEKIAAAAITPGMLLEIDSVGKVRAHATADGTALTIIALEDELQGNGIEDAYAAGDRVQVWVPARGDEAYVIIANGEIIAIGDKLVSNGDGKFKEFEDSSDNLPQSVVAIALDAIDLSGSSGEESSGNMDDQRIIVKFL